MRWKKSGIRECIKRKGLAGNRIRVDFKKKTEFLEEEIKIKARLQEERWKDLKESNDQSCEKVKLKEEK